MDHSLIYLPTEADIRAVCLEHFTKRQNWFEDKHVFALEESRGKCLADNLDFNAEFAALTGCEINLSKLQKKQAASIKQGASESKILSTDFSIKLED